MPELTWQIEAKGDVDVVVLVGDLDVYTVPRFRVAMIGRRDEGRSKFVLHLGGVEFIDSTGYGVMVGLLKKSQEAGGWTAICAADEKLLRTFRNLGLLRLFGDHDTAAEAIEAQEDSQ